MTVRIDQTGLAGQTTVNRAQRARRRWVWWTTLLAFLALPGDRFPLPWLAAFVVPALAFDQLHRRDLLRPADRLAVAATLQITAIYGVANYYAELDKLAALGCTLLPPLVWFTLRDESLDALRALFLAFCVFLIGAILGDPPDLQVVGFLGTLVLALIADSTAGAWEERASWRGRTATGLQRWRGPLLLAGAAMVLSMGLLQLLQLVPAANRGAGNGADGGPRPPAQVGLDDRFDLAGTAGRLVSLKADQLIRVTDPGGRALTRPLYLRATHFDVPGLERWTTRPRRLRGAPDETWALNTPIEGLATRSLQVEHVGPTEDFVFVPPGTYAIEDASGLIGDRNSATFRFATVPELGRSYRLRYQTAHASSSDALPAPGLSDGLFDLPADIGELRPHLAELLDDRRMLSATTPIEIAQEIAQRLAARCEYDLQGPSGPHRATLANFLSGNRRGFCMHFASVTALALRLQGVPARLGVGLYGGSPDPDDRYARIFGSQHAHAWVELPLRGIGWVVFDPTPPAARTSGQLWPSGDQDGDGALDGETDSSDADSAGSGWADSLRRLADPERYGWLWAVFGLGALALLQLRGRRAVESGGGARHRSPAQRSAHRSLEQLLQTIEQRLQQRPGPGESLEAFVARLRATHEARRLVAAAIAGYQEVRFGGRAFDEARNRRFLVALQAIREPDQTLGND